MPGDVPVLVALMRQLSGNEITPTAITGLIAPESGQAVLVAEEGGQVLGVMAMNQSPMLHRPTPDARITSLVVDEGARGRGIGRRLVDAALEHLREEMNGVLRGSGGRVAVGAITGALHSVLISAVSELRRLQPALSIEIRESTSLELLNAVNEGRLDLAIGRTTVSSNVEQFDYEELMDESVAVAVGPQHALAKSRRVTLVQLARYRWVFYPGNMPLRKLLEREFREAGLELPPYPIETSSSLATMLMLKEDPHLVALMSSATMDFCEEHGIARRLPLAIGSRHEAFGIVTRRGARLTPAAAMLVECLRRAAGQPAREGG